MKLQPMRINMWILPLLASFPDLCLLTFVVVPCIQNVGLCHEPAYLGADASLPAVAQLALWR